MFYSLSDYFSTLQVEKPNGAYSGQKLMRLVNTKTPPNTKRIIPKGAANGVRKIQYGKNCSNN
jgi:hypothetical protein